MQRVMVIGKPASGKSTFCESLALATDLPYRPLDLIEYHPSGERVAPDDYRNAHGTLIAEDQWIIDGLGTMTSFWARMDAADTLIYIDIPYSVSYWWATKRLFQGVFRTPKGWPEGSSVLKGTIKTWRYLKLSRQFWTPALMQRMKERVGTKSFHHITTVRDLNDFANGRFSGN